MERLSTSCFNICFLVSSGGSTIDLASHTLKPWMKNTYVDTHQVMSKGLELLRSSGDLWCENSAGFCHK